MTRSKIFEILGEERKMLKTGTSSFYHNFFHFCQTRISLLMFKIPYVNSLPNDKILDWSKLKAFADNKINLKCCNLITEILFGKGRKYCGKREKCWLPAFFPFPTMFSKGFFFRVVTSPDCVVKCYIVTDTGDVDQTTLQCLQYHKTFSHI